MDREQLAPIVVAARDGDADAFGVLVGEFQSVAAATAFAWLRDAEQARDVCQEAFADAWRLLRQLDDPMAFPGWFRRIVVKHCDRRTRSRATETVALESVDPAASTPDPATSAERRDEVRSLLLAIEALPRDERVVIALSYLAERSESDVAAWLELPPGTVKTRLRRARARLREEMHTMARETIRRIGPEILADDLTEVVRFYIALRAGDTETVTKLATRSPALVETPEAWDADLTYRGVLPIATRSTPIIRAVERGDTQMVETLLALGADPNQPCGCNVVEAPLWMAAVTGRHDIARALLAAGADPGVAAASGQTPIDVAIARGDETMVQLLVDRDPESLETGIAAIELFAPLTRGDLVEVLTAPMVGSTVLLAELSFRFLARGLAVTWCGTVPPPLDVHDVEGALAEAGLSRRVRLALAPATPTPGGVVFVFTSPGHEADTDRLLRGLADAGTIATFVVRPFNELPTGAVDDLRAPWDARIAFDPELAARGIWPAVDGTRSTSRARRADEDHDRIARAVVAAGSGVIAQPFFTAQPFNGRSGCYVTRATALSA